MTASDLSTARARRALTLPAKLTLTMLIGIALAFVYQQAAIFRSWTFLLYTSPSPRDPSASRMPSSA